MPAHDGIAASSATGKFLLKCMLDGAGMLAEISSGVGTRRNLDIFVNLIISL